MYTFCPSSVYASGSPAGSYHAPDTGLFSRLPTELLHQISVQLDGAALLKFRRTCKTIEAAVFSIFAIKYFSVMYMECSTHAFKMLMGVAGHRELRRYVRHIWLGTSHDGTHAPQPDYSRLLNRLTDTLPAFPNLRGLGPIKVSNSLETHPSSYLNPLVTRYGSGAPGRCSDADSAISTDIASALITAVVDAGVRITHLAFDGTIKPKILRLDNHWISLPNAFNHVTSLTIELDRSPLQGKKGSENMLQLLEAFKRVTRLDLGIPHDFEDIESLDETIYTWDQVLAFRFSNLEYLRLKSVVGEESDIMAFIAPSFSTIAEVDVEITSTLEDPKEPGTLWTNYIQDITPLCPHFESARFNFPCDALHDDWARRETLTWTKAELYNVNGGFKTKVWKCLIGDTLHTSDAMVSIPAACPTTPEVINTAASTSTTVLRTTESLSIDAATNEGTGYLKSFDTEPGRSGMAVPFRAFNFRTGRFEVSLRT